GRVRAFRGGAGNAQERDLILEESLASEDNLRVALLVGSSFADLRCRIISRFADCCRVRLRDRFRGVPAWRANNRLGVNGYLQKRGALWAVHRLVGQERVCVKLMYDKSPEKMYYAILNEKLPNLPKINWGRLKHELGTRFAAGQTSATCRWMSLVD